MSDYEQKIQLIQECIMNFLDIIPVPSNEDEDNIRKQSLTDMQQYIDKLYEL